MFERIACFVVCVCVRVSVWLFVCIGCLGTSSAVFEVSTTSAKFDNVVTLLRQILEMFRSIDRRGFVSLMS
jgi:hypothetical protein